MNQLRLDPLTNRWVTVATERASRPGDLISPEVPAQEGPHRCPFCPGNEEETPPALETYGSDGTWLLRVVPNRYPAFAGSAPMDVERLGPLFSQAPASGIHEVLVLGRDHGASWADLDDRGSGLVMAALRDRFEDHEHHSGVRYSQAIVNHGRAAGASLAHPHGQLLGIPFVPAEITDELAGFRRFDDGCLLCATAEIEVGAGHRVIADRPAGTVVAPYWSGTPFEMLVIPRTHAGHLHRAGPGELAGVGHLLRDALLALRNRLGEVAYNLVFHTLPHRSDEPFHWHIHVHPRLRSTGGFEQGTGVPINIVAPEDAASLLSA